jgi:pimeloyl-ACP methyl ester carboxylesterase
MLLAVLSFSATVQAKHALELPVTVTGQGNTVLIFESGFAQGPNAWENLITRLPLNVMIVRYHRAGNKPSSIESKAIDLEQHLLDLNDIVNHYAKGKRVILVGHSYGGLVASEFARRSPTRINGLLLIDPSVMQQRRWFKEANAQAVADEDALFASMLPPHLLAQLKLLNETLDHASADVTPLPSDLKTILLTSTRVEAQPMVFVETTAGKALWLKLHQALITNVKDSRHLQLDHVGHTIMQDDPDLVLNNIKALL